MNTLLYEVIAVSVPSVQFSTSDSQPWCTKELRDAIRLKLNLHRQYKIYNNDYFYSKFSKQRNFCKHLETSLYYNYITSIQLNIKNDCKSFWKFVNLKNRNLCLPSSMFLNNELANTGIDIVNLSDHFSSVYNNNEANLRNFNYCL